MANDVEGKLVRLFLDEEAGREYAAGRIARRHLEPLAAVLRELSDDYLQPARRPAPLSDAAAAAYALYYGQINLTKVSRLLAELPADYHARPLAILDYGCGPAAASIAAIGAFSQPLQIAALDTSSAMLAAAEKVLRLFQQERSNVACRFGKPGDGMPREKFDLIMAANVINELSNPQIFLQQCCEALTSDGALLLIEPALQPMTRRLMALRDLLLAQCPDLVPLFPCTRCGPCPMLAASSSDWCHGALDWERPQLVRQLDELTGFNKHRIKYSAFVFRKGGRLRAGYRVVSVPEKQKHAFRACVCGADRYQSASLAKRARSETNRAFEKVKLYERIVVENFGQDSTLTEASRVERCMP